MWEGETRHTPTTGQIGVRMRVRVRVRVRVSVSVRVRVRVRVGPFRRHERVRVVELGRRPDREDDHHAGRPLPRGTALHAVLAEGEWDCEYAACSR